MNLKHLWSLMNNNKSLYKQGAILEKYSVKYNNDWIYYLQLNLNNHNVRENKYCKFPLFYHDYKAMYLLYWNDENFETPIHGHTDDGCWIKVLNGSLCETKYKLQDKSIISKSYLTKDNQYYLSDRIAFHSIKPIGKHSVSLHIYTK